MRVIKKSLLVFYIVVCVSFVTWLMILKEWKLLMVAIIIGAFIIDDVLKNWNK
jgi:hypothetical protein